MKDMDSGPGSQVSRRTVVLGAAWSVPVIAAAVSVPVSSASAGQPTLAFLNGPFAVTACDPIPQLVIQATTNGTTPAIGTTVTVALPDGLTWSDGTTAPRSFVTDNAGQVKLDGLKLVDTRVSGDLTLIADGAGGPANGAVSVSPAPQVMKYYNKNSDGTSSTGTYTSPPLGSQPLGEGFWLAPDGVLYSGNKAIASNVTSGSAYPYQLKGGIGATLSVQYVTADGVQHWYNEFPDGTDSSGMYSIPAGSTTLGEGFHLAPNGDLFLDSTLVASNVSTAVAYPYESEDLTVYRSVQFVTADGVQHWYNINNVTTVAAQGTYSGVPAGAKPLGEGYWLAPNGDLYLDGLMVASGVTDAAAYLYRPTSTSTPARGIQYTTSDGVLHWYNSFVTNPATTTQGVYAVTPTGSKPLGQGYWLAPNGDLYLDDVVIDHNVRPSAVAYMTDGTQPAKSVQYVTSAC